MPRPSIETLSLAAQFDQIDASLRDIIASDPEAAVDLIDRLDDPASFVPTCGAEMAHVLNLAMFALAKGLFLWA